MLTSPREYRDALVELLPSQGDWSEGEYLWLTDRSNHLIELTDGFLEVLPMPTDEHQGILAFLWDEFKAAIGPQGVVRFAPLRLRLRAEKFREPDLLLLLDRADPRRENQFWHGADLVLEAVSPDEPERDLIVKRRDYAEAGIPEYWIVNPLDQSILVLSLDGTTYAEHGHFGRGTTATSILLPGFAVAVDAVFDAA